MVWKADEGVPWECVRLGQRIMGVDQCRRCSRPAQESPALVAVCCVIHMQQVQEAARKSEDGAETGKSREEQWIEI